MGKRKSQLKQGPTTLSPKGLKMGYSHGPLDTSTQAKPEHPLKGFTFARDSVQPRS